MIASLAALGLTSLPGISSATFIPGPPGKIVFTSGRANSDAPAPADGDDNNARLWVVDWPYGTPVQVTTGAVGVQHRHPSWSPDHTRIVYAAGAPFSGTYALRIKDLRNGSDTLFAAAAAAQDRPSWSPDGTKIVYGSEGDLWVKGVAPGSEPVQLTDTAGIQEERAVWSPDGNTLYYNRGVPPFNSGNQRDLYMKSPVTLAGKEEGLVTGTEDDWQPALSPDGKRLCFLRGEQDFTADLWTVNVSGTGAGSFTAVVGVGELNCVWSPDGTRILYTEGDFSKGQLRSRNINGSDLNNHAGYNVEKHFDGNSDWATNFPPTCDSKTASIGVNQFTTIKLSCTDPDYGPGAQPPAPDPIDDSYLEIASPPSHGTLGGLSNDETVIYTPNKDFKGTDTFKYTGSDSVSDAPPATVTIQVGLAGNGGADKTPAKISNVKVSNKRWRRGNKLAKISVLPVGTTISFKLSEAAKAGLTFQRVKPKPGGGKRYVKAGTLSNLSAKAGKNKVRFEGRLSRSKKLTPGTYRVVVGATDNAGNKSQPKNGPTFTIVK
jgi:Tol biopolymer transport system component